MARKLRASSVRVNSRTFPEPVLERLERERTALLLGLAAAPLLPDRRRGRGRRVERALHAREIGGAEPLEPVLAEQLHTVLVLEYPAHLFDVLFAHSRRNDLAVRHARITAGDLHEARDCRLRDRHTHRLELRLDARLEVDHLLLRRPHLLGLTHFRFTLFFRGLTAREARLHVAQLERLWR